MCLIAFPSTNCLCFHAGNLYLVICRYFLDCCKVSMGYNLFYSQHCLPGLHCIVVIHGLHYIAHVFREFEGRGHQKFSWGLCPQTPIMSSPPNKLHSVRHWGILNSFYVVMCLIAFLSPNCLRFHAGNLYLVICRYFLDCCKVSLGYNIFYSQHCLPG